MKYLYLTMTFLLLAVVAMAAEQAPEGQDATDHAAGDSVEREERSAPGSAETPPQAPSAGSAWPRQFVPTEKINADSVVSFPTDI